MIEEKNINSQQGSGQYGQDAEYRLSALVLRQLAAAVVVDVGVEKGSFVDLALESGAARVIGFEPLPRHQAFLQQRFGGMQQVVIHPLAISNANAFAQFHIALDRDGNELDYHHTLGDLGDSATVVRSARAIQVETASLSTLVAEGVVPAQIDFLKIDTDGHDLSVLEGLGDVRPKVILAEYWDTLPETSGQSPYVLRDLVAWASGNGYAQILTVRRHGRLERIEWNAPWTVPGDWGNVFFFAPDYPLKRIQSQLEEIAMQSYSGGCHYIQTLTDDLESKEVEIQSLDARVRGAASTTRTSPPPANATSAHVSRASRLEKPEASFRRQLEEKELVIQDQARALQAYRAAFFLTRPLMPLARAGSGIFRLLMPKLGRLRHHDPRELVLPDQRKLVPGTAVPSISIVTPSFKQAAFIQRTIDSVVHQNYPRLEYFVQDGGSDDGTVEILRRNEGRLIGWESAADTGQSQAINLGFQKTSGEIMAWLNSDDLLMPGALTRVAEYFVAHPEIDVVYGNRILIDEEDREIGRWVLPKHSDGVLSWADFVPQETLFWRRRLWDRVGGRIDENFRFAMDWDLLLRFRDAGARMARVPYFLGGFRIHDRQKTSALINEIGSQEMAQLRRRELGRNSTWAELRRALIPYLICHIGHDLAFRVRRRLGMST